MTHVLEMHDLVHAIFTWLGETTQVIVESVNRTFRQACIEAWNRRFPTLQPTFAAFLRIHSKKRQLRQEVLVEAARYGSLDILDCVHGFLFAADDSAFYSLLHTCNVVVHEACRIGNERVLEWVLKRRAPRDRLLDQCLKEGNSLGIQLILERSALTFSMTMNFARKAAARGRFDIVDHLDLVSLDGPEQKADLQIWIETCRKIHAGDTSVESIIRQVWLDGESDLLREALISGPNPRLAVEMARLNKLGSSDVALVAGLVFQLQRDNLDFLAWYVEQPWANKGFLILMEAMRDPRVDTTLLDALMALPISRYCTVESSLRECFWALCDSDRLWTVEHCARIVYRDYPQFPIGDDRSAIIARLVSLFMPSATDRSLQCKRQIFVSRMANRGDFDMFRTCLGSVVTRDDLAHEIASHAFENGHWDILLWYFSKRRPKIGMDPINAVYDMYLASKVD